MTGATVVTFSNDLGTLRLGRLPLGDCPWLIFMANFGLTFATLSVVRCFSKGRGRGLSSSAVELPALERSEMSGERTAGRNASVRGS